MDGAAEQKRNPESNLPYRSNEFDVCIHNPEIDFFASNGPEASDWPQLWAGSKREYRCLHNGVKSLRNVFETCNFNRHFSRFQVFLTKKPRPVKLVLIRQKIRIHILIIGC